MNSHRKWGSFAKCNLMRECLIATMIICQWTLNLQKCKFWLSSVLVSVLYLSARFLYLGSNKNALLIYGEWISIGKWQAYVFNIPCFFRIHHCLNMHHCLFEGCVGLQPFFPLVIGERWRPCSGREWSREVGDFFCIWRETKHSQSALSRYNPCPCCYFNTELSTRMKKVTDSRRNFWSPFHTFFRVQSGTLNIYFQIIAEQSFLCFLSKN